MTLGSMRELSVQHLIEWLRVGPAIGKIDASVRTVSITCHAVPQAVASRGSPNMAR